MSIGCPRLTESGAIDLHASQIDPRDPAGVSDVVQRVGVEDDEVGALASGDRAELIEPQDLRRRARRGDDRLAPASCPAATMSASSACADQPYGAPTPASVPNAMRTPAADSFARLRAWTSKSRGRGGDATAVLFSSSIATAEASR